MQGFFLILLNSSLYKSFNDTINGKFSFVPGQLSVTSSTVKQERARYFFSREWHQDQKGGRKGLIVRGRTGPRTVKRAKVPGNLPHIYSYHLYTVQ